MRVAGRERRKDRWLVFAFVIGVLNLSVQAATESARHWGLTHGDCVQHGIPWTLIMISALLIAPYTLGRARAGAAWEALSLRISGRGPAQATVTMKPEGAPEPGGESADIRRGE